MSLGKVAVLVLLVLVAAAAQLASAQPRGLLQEQSGEPQRQLLQALPRFSTGLNYVKKGVGSAPNATRRSYITIRSARSILRNMGAVSGTEEIARAACNNTNVMDSQCIDVLLLLLTPEAYSSNKTADTPGRRAFISPAQNQGDDCLACVGFAVTAAAEAAVNLYKQQNWDKLGLSEQDLSFCKPTPLIRCASGADYDTVVTSINKGEVDRWAARTCYPYTAPMIESCIPVEPNGRCTTQLPLGGKLSVAYNGNPLDTMAKAKEQIMLNGGVMTSMAMSYNAFDKFAKNVTTPTGVFNIAEDLRSTPQSDVVMHGVFCYGWWDNPRRFEDGYWICKNSWSTSWGLQGSFRVAYAAANIMQPDYTFALQYNRASITARFATVKRRLQSDLSPSSPPPDIIGWKPECFTYTSKTPTRLLKLADDLNTLALAEPATSTPLSKADIIVDLVMSNLGSIKNLSVASKGPFRVCGKTAQLLSSLLLGGSSPAPRPSPSPRVKPPSPAPSPAPNHGGVANCTLNRATDPQCSRCVRTIAIAEDHICVLLYDSSVSCSGFGGYGQLGDGQETYDGKNLIAASILAPNPVSSLAVGWCFTCVLAAAGGNNVYCVGYGNDGVLGGGLPMSGSKQPIAIQGLKFTPPVTQLVGNPEYESTFVCAAYANTGDFDTVQCWGGIYGVAPIDIAGTSGTTYLASGGGQTCALMSDHTVVCWQAPSVVARQVAGISNATRVTAGGGFACAIVRSAGSLGSLWCWGKDQGQTVSDSNTPWKVIALAGNVLDVAAGLGHVCALIEVGAGSGDVYCWGDNSQGQLGQGNTNATQAANGVTSSVLPPVRVMLKESGISKVTAVFAAVNTTCALTASQRVLCWGNNKYSKMGTGSDPINGEPATLPVFMKGLCA